MMSSRNHIFLICSVFVLIIFVTTNLFSFSSDNIPPPPPRFFNFERESVPSSSDGSSNPLSIFEIFQSKKEKFNICMKNAATIFYDETDKFFDAFSTCIKTHYSIPETKMDFFKNNVHGEKKVFVSMAEEYQQEKCKWLTIGIGGSTTAEENFHAKYPNCEIFGVDPTNFANFSKIGKLYTNGVGLEDDEITLSVDLSNNPKQSAYRQQKLSVVAFPRMLDEFVGSRLVHYLAFDIEGMEMLIMSELIGNGKFANENITFCQIDVELHNPKQDSIIPLASKIHRVQWVLDFLQDSSPYIPVYTIPYQPAHKVTFINVVNPECDKAFKISSYLGSNNL